MADSFVCSGAMMKCSMGTSPARLTVLPDRTVDLAGQPQANISDHQSMVNLAPFGLCRSMGYPSTASATAAAQGTLTPMPCIHNTPVPWMNGKMDTFIKGQPALLKSCTCQCMWGGIISLINNGQVGQGAQGVSKTPKNKTSSSEYNEDYSQDKQIVSKQNKPMPQESHPLALLTKKEALGLEQGKQIFGEKKWAEMIAWAKLYTGKDISVSDIKRIRGCPDMEAEEIMMQVEKQRVFLAYNEYRDKWPDTPLKVIKSHLNGIDFSKPVVVRTIPEPGKSLKVVQNVVYHVDGSFELGNYFASPLSKPGDVGVSASATRHINRSKGGRIRELVINQHEGVLKIYETGQPVREYKLLENGFNYGTDNSNADILDYLSSHKNEEMFGCASIAEPEQIMRLPVEFEITTPVTVLESTASQMIDAWSLRRKNKALGKEEPVNVFTTGSRKQLFSPELKALLNLQLEQRG